jgi:hypothetical protein
MSGPASWNVCSPLPLARSGRSTEGLTDRVRVGRRLLAGTRPRRSNVHDVGPHQRVDGASGEHLQGPGSRPTPLAWSGNEVALSAFDLDDVLVGSTSIVETAGGPYRLALTGLGPAHRVVVDATLSDPTVGGIGFESISGSSGLVRGL